MKLQHTKRAPREASRAHKEEKTIGGKMRKKEGSWGKIKVCVSVCIPFQKCIAGRINIPVTTSYKNNIK